MGRRSRLTAVGGAMLLVSVAGGCEPAPSPWHAEVLSASVTGQPGNGASGNNSINSDGTKVAFSSNATDLVADGEGDGIFLRDLTTGTTTRLTTFTASLLYLSPDGTKLAGFIYKPNIKYDLFVFDIATGTSTVLPDARQSFPAESTYLDAQWSPDSARFVFRGQATAAGNPREPNCLHILPGNQVVTYNCFDIYLYDVASGVTTLVSASPDGATAGTGDGDTPSFSPDGTKVLYASKATNQVPTDTTQGHIYLRDLVSGTTSVMDATATSGATSSSLRPRFSADGTKVLFDSHSVSLDPAVTDTNRRLDVYVRDLSTGTIRMVSVNAGGGASGNEASFAGQFSPDGTKVAFMSMANDFGPVDTHARTDVYVRDLAAGTTRLASTNVTCDDSGDDWSTIDALPPVFSPDGQRVLFLSEAKNLARGNENGLLSVFVHDLATCTTHLVSAPPNGEASQDGRAGRPMFVDANRVVFGSQASDLVPDDANGGHDVFLATLHGADLSVAGERAWADGQLDYALEVANDGPDAAEDAEVALQVPATADFVSGSPDCSGPTPEHPDVVVCELGGIAAGTAVDVHVTLAVAEPPGAHAVALVSASTTEPDQRNNTAAIP